MMTKLPKIEPSGVEPSFDKKAERLICGVAISGWRKAYFGGEKKMKTALADMQAKGEPTEDGLAELKNLLESFRTGDEHLLGELGMLEKSDPVLDEIEDVEKVLTPEQQAMADDLQAKRDKYSALARKIIHEVGSQLHSKGGYRYTQEELMDLAGEMMMCKGWVGDDEIHKDQLFSHKVVHIEKLGKQRKLAEQYAKVSNEYRNWRKAEKLEEDIKGWNRWAEKRYKPFG